MAELTTEELTEKVETLETRLAKATDAYKTVKAELDAAKKQITVLTEKLEAENPNAPTVDQAELESLRQKVKDYEDELAINGNPAEEIATLNERLTKAKQIFTEQKENIKTLRAELDTKTKELTETEDALKESETSLIATNERLAGLKVKLSEIVSVL